MEKRPPKFRSNPGQEARARKIERFSDSESTLMAASNPASWNLWPFHQRRRRRLLRLKCTDSTPPLDIKFFVCGKTRATILPRENFITIHTQIFTLQVLGRNEQESEPILKASKNRLKFYIVNKVCQTGQKYTFYVQI